MNDLSTSRFATEWMSLNIKWMWFVGNGANIPEVNKDLFGMDTFTVSRSLDGQFMCGVDWRDVVMWLGTGTGEGGVPAGQHASCHLLTPVIILTSRVPHTHTPIVTTMICSFLSNQTSYRLNSQQGCSLCAKYLKIRKIVNSTITLKNIHVFKLGQF